mgnify:CR=1 FL=1
MSFTSSSSTRSLLDEISSISDPGSIGAPSSHSSINPPEAAAEETNPEYARLNDFVTSYSDLWKLLPKERKILYRAASKVPWSWFLEQHKADLNNDLWKIKQRVTRYLRSARRRRRYRAYGLAKKVAYIAARRSSFRRRYYRPRRFGRRYRRRY